MEGSAGLMWLAGLTAYADFLLLLQLPVGFLALRRIACVQVVAATQLADCAGSSSGTVAPDFCDSRINSFDVSVSLARAMVGTVDG